MFAGELKALISLKKCRIISKKNMSQACSQDDEDEGTHDVLMMEYHLQQEMLIT
jgi:hypothetical protein